MWPCTRHQRHGPFDILRWWRRKKYPNKTVIQVWRGLPWNYSWINAVESFFEKNGNNFNLSFPYFWGCILSCGGGDPPGSSLSFYCSFQRLFKDHCEWTGASPEQKGMRYRVLQQMWKNLCSRQTLLAWVLTLCAHACVHAQSMQVTVFSHTGWFWERIYCYKWFKMAKP